MPPQDHSNARSRILSAAENARANGAEMLCVAFPPLPENAFANLVFSEKAEALFYFENAKKNIADAAFDFRKNRACRKNFRLSEIENFLPKKIETLALDNAVCVPAPKIFVAGTFDESAAASPLAAIPTWQISRANGATQISAHVFLNETDENFAETLLREFAFLEEISKTETAPAPLSKISELGEPGGDWYSEKCARAVAEIEAGNFEKIVLARAKDFAFSETGKFPAHALCAKLRERFLASGCTIFCVSTDAENFDEKIVGASPEMLVSLRGGKIETEAIAGTRANDGSDGDALAKSLFDDAKERNEHRLVVDFIAEKLRALDLSPNVPECPEILRLPNVFHLRTPIEPDVPAESISLGKIAEALHPTPAMCGIPAQKAKDFIRANEPFSRGHFSAPLGFVDSEGNGFFAVAIRCAQIFSDRKMRLYAGSGLVRGSLPQKESREIDTKFSALASLLSQRD